MAYGDKVLFSARSYINLLVLSINISQSNVIIIPEPLAVALLCRNVQLPVPVLLLYKRNESAAVLLVIEIVNQYNPSSKICS